MLLLRYSFLSLSTGLLCQYLIIYNRPYYILVEYATWLNIVPERYTDSGVARAFPGGPVAHPEGQNEEENSKF